jgi:hypothetical protein
MSAGDFQGTYAAEKVIISIGGVTMSGFTDGDFVTVKYDEDRYTKKAGADGEVGRSKNASRAGSVEVVLSGTSAANDEMSALFNLAQIGGIDPPVPITVADLSGRSLASASNAWIKTVPDLVFGKDITDRSWVFDTADLIINVGGNN